MRKCLAISGLMKRAASSQNMGVNNIFIEKEKMNNFNDLEKLIMGNKPVHCDMRNGKMFYIGSGKYRCEKCGYRIR